MRSGQVLLIYLLAIGANDLCEGLKSGDPGVCEEQIPKVLVKTRKVRCSTGWCISTYKHEKIHITSLTCCDGWEYNDDKNICQPICNPICENGNCVSPDVCVCDPPLVNYNNFMCWQPICDPPCLNAVCKADNFCICNSDYERINRTHCGPKCERGYHLDPVKLECRPSCNNPCVNGKCIAPNNCTCNEGFKHSDDGSQCIAECDPECVHGICTGPYICECLPGYIGDIESRCRPVCHHCEHGQCIEPNVCQCHEGYVNNNGSCLPHCQPGYKISDTGNCTECDLGYIKFDSRNCSLKCDDVKDGECVEANACRYRDGYVFINGSCTPKCKEPCYLGYCSEPDTCVCKSGYKKTAKSKYICEPACSKPCVNGICVAPDTCSCLAGFKPTNTSHKCGPKCDSCENGSCVAPELCICEEGYTMRNEKCMPECEAPCVNGNCYSPNKCICDTGYVQDDQNPNICYKICEDNTRCLEDGCCEQTPVDCYTCQGTCIDGICICKDTNMPCYISGSELQITSLAGMQLTWLFAAAVGFLLLIGLIVVIIRMHKKGRSYETKTSEGNLYGSVVYTSPENLINCHQGFEGGINETSPNQTTAEPLLMETVELTYKEMPIV